MEKIKYIGCFFDLRELEARLASFPRQPLEKPIDQPHVTFVYRPREVPWEAFGQRIPVEIVGYGRDEENEALAVRFPALPESLQILADAIPVPHITLSVSRNGKPVNSSRLRFSPVTPFVIEGVFGGLDVNDDLRT